MGVSAGRSCFYRHRTTLTRARRVGCPGAHIDCNLCLVGLHTLEAGKGESEGSELVGQHLVGVEEVSGGIAGEGDGGTREDLEENVVCCERECPEEECWCGLACRLGDDSVRLISVREREKAMSPVCPLLCLRPLTRAAGLHNKRLMLPPSSSDLQHRDSSQAAEQIPTPHWHGASCSAPWYPHSLIMPFSVPLERAVQ